MAVAVHPELLLGVAEGDEEDVGRGGVDAAKDFVVVHGFERGGGRGVVADEVCAGVLLFEDADGAQGVFVGGAEKKDAVAFFGGEFGELGGKVRAGEACLERAAEEAGDEDEGVAVGEDHGALADDAVQFGVLAGVADEVEVGGGDLVAAAGADAAVDAADCLRPGDVADGRPSNATTRAFLRTMQESLSSEPWNQGGAVDLMCASDDLWNAPGAEHESRRNHESVSALRRVPAWLIGGRRRRMIG